MEAGAGRRVCWERAEPAAAAAGPEPEPDRGAGRQLGRAGRWQPVAGELLPVGL